MSNETISNGDVIQITNAQHHWFPALCIVDEIKGFGCQAYVIVPQRNDAPQSVAEAYIRLNTSDYERIGVASFSHEERA